MSYNITGQQIKDVEIMLDFTYGIGLAALGLILIGIVFL